MVSAVLSIGICCWSWRCRPSVGLGHAGTSSSEMVSTVMFVSFYNVSFELLLHGFCFTWENTGSETASAVSKLLDKLNIFSVS